MGHGSLLAAPRPVHWARPGPNSRALACCRAEGRHRPDLDSHWRNSRSQPLRAIWRTAWATRSLTGRKAQRQLLAGRRALSPVRPGVGHLLPSPSRLECVCVDIYTLVRQGRDAGSLWIGLQPPPWRWVVHSSGCLAAQGSCSFRRHFLDRWWQISPHQQGRTSERPVISHLGTAARRAAWASETSPPIETAACVGEDKRARIEKFLGGPAVTSKPSQPVRRRQPRG